jgi:ElaB/YqjD/DUF883 family membrane-anchored ribosome-binding protein
MNMERTPEQIAGEIDEVRERMDATLDALEHRLSARELLRDGLDYVRYSNAARYAVRASRQAGQTAREHPVAAALAGASLVGLAYWGWRWSHASRGTGSGAHLRHLASAVEAARGKLHDARHALPDLGHSARRHLSDAAAGVRSRIAHTGRSSQTLVREHPVAAGATGFAVLALTVASVLYGRNRLR